MNNSRRTNEELWGIKNEEISKRDRTADILKKIAILHVNGLSIGDVLLEMGISKVKIYGLGKVGQKVFEGIKNKVDICGIYDANAKNIEIDEEYKCKLFAPDEIQNDNVPIIITPSAAFQSISFKLIDEGIDRFNILAINTILTYGMELLKDNKVVSNYKEGAKQFLITGAGFGNKGAQAMLFVAASEIRRRFDNAIIWFLPIDDFKRYTCELQDFYNFQFILDNVELSSQVFEIVLGLSAIIDISGYGFASFLNNERYMQTMRIARNYDIPLYLMPQSCGPFDFNEIEEKEWKELLAYPRVIYAREKSAYDFLKDNYLLNNVRLSNDLVLQNKAISLDYIYREFVTKEEVSSVSPHSVAIVPNMQCYCRGTIEENLLWYKAIIDCLLTLDRNVYIVAHSDDQVVCRDIYTMYRNEPKVHLCVKELDCIEFSKYIRQFDFIVASRFHAIVHAYKENVPCIVIGWADKYNALLKDFKQSQYMFDIREGVDTDKLLNAIQQMNSSYINEKETIKGILPSMQQENCFDILTELMGE